MTLKDRIVGLFDQFEHAIVVAYTDARSNSGQSIGAERLRDYCPDHAPINRLDRLVRTEAEHEKRHREMGRAFLSECGASIKRPPISSGVAAMLIVMRNAADGDMPDASDYLVIRDSAFEAQIIGALVRPYLSDEWRAAVQSLDYAKIMDGAA